MENELNNTTNDGTKIETNNKNVTASETNCSEEQPAQVPLENSNSKTEITKVNEETVYEDSIEYTYGVKVTTTNAYKVITYSDGNIDKTLINTKKNYDKSTFSVTTNDLKPEATLLAAKNKSIYEEVLSYVNGYRAEVGAQNLVLNDELSVLATVRALEMVWSGKFSHTRPDETLCFTVMNNLSYVAVNYGENIAQGYGTAASVSEGWKNSSGHYANMIDEGFNNIGIGMAQLDGSKYWVQLFTN